MWIVPSKSSNIVGLVNYDFAKKEEGVSKSLTSNIPFPDDKDYVLSLFNSLKSQARGNVTSHFVTGTVNLAPNEYLTDEQLVNAVEQYLKKINMEDHPVYISKHTDKDHLHVHFIAARQNLDGSFHNERGVFFRKDAKQVSNELNELYGFGIIDNIQSADKRGNKSYKEHAAINYSIHRALQSSGSDTKHLPVDKSTLNYILKEKLSNSQVITHLGESKYNLLINALGKDVIEQQGYRERLRIALESYYKDYPTKAAFLDAIKANPNLYAREIMKEKTETNEKKITYGIMDNGKMRYIDESKLAIKFSWRHLGNMVDIKAEALRALTYDQQRMILKRTLPKILMASDSLTTYFDNLSSFGIGHEKTYSGDRLTGYRLWLKNASAADVFKASLIDRAFTISKVTDYFESSEEKQREVQTEKTPTGVEQFIARQPEAPVGGGGVKRGQDEKDPEESAGNRKKRKKKLGK